MIKHEISVIEIKKKDILLWQAQPVRQFTLKIKNVRLKIRLNLQTHLNNQVP